MHGPRFADRHQAVARLNTDAIFGVIDRTGGCRQQDGIFGQGWRVVKLYKTTDGGRRRIACGLAYGNDDFAAWAGFAVDDAEGPFWVDSGRPTVAG